MELTDLFLAPVYLLIFYIILYRIKNKHYKESPYAKYFIPAFTVKVIGAITTGLIYYFYYGDGDTIQYFYRTTLVHHWLMKDPYYGLKILFSDSSKYYYDISALLEILRSFDTSSFMVVRVSSLLSLISFRNYTVIALFFSLFAFSGVWKLFITLSKIKPELTSKFAISCLFIPSVFFWGSGLFKDTLTLGAIGWLTYASVNIFIFKEISLKKIIIFFSSAYFIFIIKAYIILSFLPALLFLIVFTYQSKIKNNAIRVLLTPFVSLISIGAAYYALTQMGDYNTYWSFSEIQDRAKDMQWWHNKVLELYGTEGGGGSNYSVGDGSFTIVNLIKSFPVALGVTFFGPPIWKVNNPIMLLSSLESLVFLYLTIKVYLSVGLTKAFKYIIANPILFFMFFFSISFGFAVGFSSFNYGALVRYKIPCLPFYLSTLFYLQYLAKQEITNIKPKMNKKSV